MLAENFDQLYEKHFTEIYRHCYHIVRNKEDSEELSNETFVKAYFHRDQFDAQKGNFRSWIFGIATNLCLDFIRSAAQKRQQQTNSIDDLIHSASDTLQPDEHSELKELLQFIEDCLARLNDIERLAVSLRHLQDFTLQEIAKILDMKSPNSAKNRIKSGEKELKQCLENKGIDDNYWHGA